MLNKTIALQYHRKSVGLYLLILFVAAGFLRGEEHVQLAKIILGKIELLAFLALGWAFFLAKSTFFFVQIMQQPDYEFLYGVALLPKTKKWPALVNLQLSLNAIFLLYSLFMISVGIKENLWHGVFILLIINVLYLVLPVIWKNNFLKYPNKIFFKTALLKWQFPSVSIPSWAFFTTFLFRKDPIYLLLQKTYAAIVISGMAYFYPTDDYDERLLKLGLFFVASGYFTLTQRYFDFFRQGFWFSKALPISTTTILLHFFVNALIFTLPELLLFASYLPVDVPFYFVVDGYIFVVLNAVFWQGAVFWLNLQRTNTALLLFLGHIMLFVLLMYGVSLSVFAFTFFVITALAIRKYYYRYEPTEE